MRVFVPVTLCLAIALAGCGSDSTDSSSTKAPATTAGSTASTAAPRPSDAALGKTANAVLAAARDHDAKRFCALLPDSTARAIHGKIACSSYAASELPSARAGEVFNLLGPRPGPVRKIVDVTDSKALTRLINANAGAWFVLVGGGSPRPLTSAAWKAAFAQMTPAVRRETQQLAHDGLQCVVVTPTAAGDGLRGFWDKTCTLYAQRDAQ